MLIVVAIFGWSVAAVAVALTVSKQRALSQALVGFTNARVKTQALQAEYAEMVEALQRAREDARLATYELKAEKKKRYAAGHDKTADAPLQAELSQLRSRLVAATDARDAAQRQVEAARADRDETQNSLAQMREALRAHETQASGDKAELLERLQQAEKDLLTMRRRLEEQRRVHLLQRAEAELIADKLAHVRGRYLHLCGDYVQLTREHPPRAARNDVFTLSGARELELLREEHEQYERAQLSDAS